MNQRQAERVSVFVRMRQREARARTPAEWLRHAKQAEAASPIRRVTDLRTGEARTRLADARLAWKARQENGRSGR